MWLSLYGNARFTPIKYNAEEKHGAEKGAARSRKGWNRLVSSFSPKRETPEFQGDSGVCGLLQLVA